MRKHYNEIINNFDYPAYYSDDGFIVALFVVGNIDPFSLNSRENVEEVMTALTFYVDKHQIESEYSLEKIPNLNEFLNEEELNSLISLLKQVTQFNFNHLVLNYILKSQNLIFSERSRKYKYKSYYN